MGTCPICGPPTACIPTTPRGFWEGRVLPLMGLRTYRCPECGLSLVRRHGWNGTPVPPKRGFDLAEPAQFLPPEDDRNFDEFIQEIQEAEKQLRLDEDEGDRGLP